jgi:hypothetical protein
MPYNDEQTRKDEEQFQQHLKVARSLTKEEKEILTKGLDLMTESIIRLAAIPSPTAEELALLDKVKIMMLEVTETLGYMKDVLGESAKRQAYAYYLHIKKLAEEGNPDAKKVYEDLKPDYQASLRSEMGDN